MSSNIKIKRSEVSGNPAVLGAGELAYSALVDNGSNGGDRLYIGMGTETAGNAVNHVVIGGKYFTDMITAATAANTNNTLVKRDASGNFVAGTITANLNGNSATTTKWLTARSIALTGDASATFASVDGTGNVSTALTLATVNSNVGSFGGTTAIPVIAVNAKGLVTSAYTVTIATSLAISGNSGTDTVSLADNTLAINGGTGVQTVVTDNTVTINIGQAVATTSNVTFNNLTLDGNLLVKGTTTTVNSTAVAIADVNLTLAKDATTSAQADGAGLTVAGADATLTYTSANDRWNFNKDLVVANVYAALKGNADTTTKWLTARDLSLTGDATATLASVDGTAAVSAAITLATVNTNIGSFGTATKVPNFTVNGKGLITAAGSTDIPNATSTILGLASFSADNFTVTSGAVVLSTVDGGTY